MMHILWDWNGTLLDDTRACVDSLNTMLAKRGLKTVTFDYFRENFAFPARQFYRLVGMDVPDDEWDALAREYHVTYARQRTIRLNPDAVAAIEEVKRRGWKQSILSALHQNLLEADLDRYGIRGYFDFVYGSDNYDGGSKLARARELLAKLAPPSPGDSPAPSIVLIGDSLHDREVADALGIGCVLVSTGGHSHARLAAAGRVAETLTGALNLL